MSALRRRQFKDILELPLPQREVELEKAHTRAALKYMFTHPAHELSLIPKRISRLYENDRPSGGLVFGEPGDSYLKWAADLYFYGPLLFGAIGLVLSLRRERAVGWAIPAIFIYCNVLHSLLFFAIPRFHAPLVPLLCVAIGLACVELPRRRSE